MIPEENKAPSVQVIMPVFCQWQGWCSYALNKYLRPMYHHIDVLSNTLKNWNWKYGLHWAVKRKYSNLFCLTRNKRMPPLNALHWGNYSWLWRTPDVDESISNDTRHAHLHEKQTHRRSKQWNSATSLVFYEVFFVLPFKNSPPT